MKPIYRVAIALSIITSTFIVASNQSVSAVSSNPSAVCSGATCTVTFPYTGDVYTWTNPVSGPITFELWGAQGGNAGYNGVVSGSGGKGGYTTGIKVLNLGETVSVYVGGQGAGATGTGLSDLMSGGFNGGGNGYNGDSSTYRDAGGGGASDVRIANSRILIAGGGGGGTSSAYGVATPGVGGGTLGADGVIGGYAAVHQGKGGSQSAGGAGGSNGGNASPGTQFNGGSGLTSHTFGSSGGGGGYFGGGGAGAGMAAGGGSGFIAAGVTSSQTIAGSATMPNPVGGTMTGRTGNGIIRISYQNIPTTVTLSIAGDVKIVSKGVGIVLNSAISEPGFVTFYANGKRIAGCINKYALAGNKTCTWKPSLIKSTQVYATLSQGGTVVASSAPLVVAGVKRTGTR